MKKVLCSMFYVLGFFFLVSGYWFLVSSQVYAVEIEPMRLEHSLEAGKTYSGSFLIKNSSNSASDISISTGEYRYLSSQEVLPPVYGQTRLPSCRDWLKFEKTRFSLGPGEGAEAKFFINVPKAAAREHLCAVIFDEKGALPQAGPDEKTPGARINLIPRFSIPVYICIKGAEKISAEITNLAGASEFQKGAVIINLTLENTGNVHIRPLGTLIILNQSGEVVKNLPIGRSPPLFPGYKEIIPVTCRGLPAGKYSAVATVEIAKDKIVQGKAAFTVKNSGEAE